MMNQGALNFTPDYEQVCGILKHLNSEELTHLLNDEDKLHSMIKDLQQVKNIETERELLLASNKSLSEFNLSQKPVLDDTRRQLHELYCMASELKKEVSEKKAKLEQIKGTQAPDTILALLQAAAAEIEDETEEYVNKFLDGDTPIKIFLEEYLKKRKLAHLRRAKSEKMAQLLQKSQPNKSPPARPPRPNRQKPPAPPTPVTTGNPFRTTGLPPVPSNSFGSSAVGMPRSTGSPVVPTRRAPHPPRKFSLGNEVIQSLNETHISSISSDAAKPAFSYDSSYVTSYSQPIMNLNLNRSTPYPVYPAAMPFTPCIPQAK